MCVLFFLIPSVSRLIDLLFRCKVIKLSWARDTKWKRQNKELYNQLTKSVCKVFEKESWLQTDKHKSNYNHIEYYYLWQHLRLLEYVSPWDMCSSCMLLLFYFLLSFSVWLIFFFVRSFESEPKLICSDNEKSLFTYLQSAFVVLLPQAASTPPNSLNSPASRYHRNRLCFFFWMHTLTKRVRNSRKKKNKGNKTLV